MEKLEYKYMRRSKILIVGDTIIDEDIFLIASGISLETP